MPKRFAYVTSYQSRHGKTYYRFRRKGYDAYTFKEPFGTKAFEREYAACLSREPRPVAGERTVPGSVADVITKSEKAILTNVDSAMDKIVPPDALRRAAQMTPAGFRRVANRMVKRSLITRTCEGDLTITFSGMQVMRGLNQ